MGAPVNVLVVGSAADDAAGRLRTADLSVAVHEGPVAAVADAIDGVDCVVVTHAPDTDARATVDAVETVSHARPALPVVVWVAPSEDSTGLRLASEALDAGATDVVDASGDSRLATGVRSAVAERRPRRHLDVLDDVTDRLAGATDRDAVCEIAVGTARDDLDLPPTAAYLRERDGGFRRVAARPPSASFPASFAADPAADEGLDAADEALGRTLRAVAESGDRRRFRERHGDADHYGIVAPLGEYGAVVSVADRSPTVADRRRLDLVAALAGSVLERIDREHRLGQLHGATRALMDAHDAEGVARVATRTADEVLGLPNISVFLCPDEGPDRLEPVASSDEARETFDEVPTLYPGESLAWEVFESGESQLYSDVSESGDAYNPDTPVRTEMILPLGDHGVFMAASLEPDAFDKELFSLVEVLAANVEAALDRVEREEQLRERERELERQNERLDEFAAFVSHDLRNPLNVAEGNLELARTFDDPEKVAERLDRVATAHDNMRTLVDDLLTLARSGQRIGDVESADLGAAVRESWSRVEGGELTVAADAGVVEADPDRLRALLTNLLSNAVDHGDEDVSVEVGRLDDRTGFYVADDGPGIPPDEREEVFEAAYTTAEDGTGIGLAIVRSVAEAHDWTVSVEASAAGGAKFVVETDGAAADREREPETGA